MLRLLNAQIHRCHGGRIVANWVCLLIATACFAQAPDALPTIGPQFLLQGDRISEARADPAALRAFIEAYRNDRDAEAWRFGLLALKDNLFVPDDFVTGFLEPLAQRIDNVGEWPPAEDLVRYQLRFSNQGQMDLWVNTRLGMLCEVRLGGPAAALEDKTVTRPSTPISLRDALGFFRNQQVRLGMIPEKMVFSAAYYGRGESVLLAASFLESSVRPPSPPRRYIMCGQFWNPFIGEGSPREYLAAVLRELPQATDAQRRAAVHAYLSLSDPEAMMLTSYRDIPGAKRGALDPDLQRAIGPLTHFNRGRDSEQDVYVVYTWRRLGGVLKRHRFTFESESRAAIEEVVLGNKMGTASYHM
jgi:hypothetical protein